MKTDIPRKCVWFGMGIGFAFLFATLPTSAERPVWAKRGVHFPARCYSDSVNECRPLRIPSPDKQNFAIVQYGRLLLDDGDFVLVSRLQIVEKDRTSREAGLRYAIEDELVWSPDSSAFFVTGSAGGEGPQFVDDYLLKDADLNPHSIIEVAQMDMVKSFPPCRAKDADKRDCSQLEEHPKYINMVAVDWAQGSSAVVLMGEMPCSSRFGGIMCSVLGYEVEATTGKILRRMEAKEFAQRWQRSMAWRFRDPGPPEYDPK